MVITAFVLTGCGSDQKKNKEGYVTNKVENEKMSAADKRYALLKEGEAWDQKTVEWDGETARMVKAGYDSDVDDGKSGPTCNNRYTADQLIEFDYPYEFEQVDSDEEIGLTTTKIYIFAFYNHDVRDELKDINFRTECEKIELSVKSDKINTEQKWRSADNAFFCFSVRNCISITDA